MIIAEYIRQNDSIMWLNLSDNPLGRLGAKLMFKLVDVLGESRTLVFAGCNLDVKSKYCGFDAATPQVCVYAYTHKNKQNILCCVQKYRELQQL